MTEIATIDRFGRWGTFVFSENTAIFLNLFLVENWQRISMLKAQILPKTHRWLRSNFQMMQRVLLLVYILIAKYVRLPSECILTNLMLLKRKNFISLPSTPFSALHHHVHVHFQTKDID